MEPGRRRTGRHAGSSTGLVEAVLIAPGTEWYSAELSGPFIRLNFSSEDPNRFAEASEVLGNAPRSLP